MKGRYGDRAYHTQNRDVKNEISTQKIIPYSEWNSVYIIEGRDKTLKVALTDFIT